MLPVTPLSSRMPICRLAVDDPAPDHGLQSVELNRLVILLVDESTVAVISRGFLDQFAILDDFDIVPLATEYRLAYPFSSFLCLWMISSRAGGISSFPVAGFLGSVNWKM